MIPPVVIFSSIRRSKLILSPRGRNFPRVFHPKPPIRQKDPVVRCSPSSRCAIFCPTPFRSPLVPLPSEFFSYSFPGDTVSLPSPNLFSISSSHGLPPHGRSWASFPLRMDHKGGPGVVLMISPSSHSFLKVEPSLVLPLRCKVNVYTSYSIKVFPSKGLLFI